MASKHVNTVPDSIGYRGSPDTYVLSKTGDGVGATIVTGDGTAYEVVWNGGEGLTADHGSAMFALLPMTDNPQDDPEAVATLRLLSSKGGQRRAENLAPERRSQIARLGGFVKAERARQLREEIQQTFRDAQRMAG